MHTRFKNSSFRVLYVKPSSASPYFSCHTSWKSLVEVSFSYFFPTKKLYKTTQNSLGTSYKTVRQRHNQRNNYTVTWYTYSISSLYFSAFKSPMKNTGSLNVLMCFHIWRAQVCLARSLRDRCVLNTWIYDKWKTSVFMYRKLITSL